MVDMIATLNEGNLARCKNTKARKSPGWKVDEVVKVFSIDSAAVVGMTWWYQYSPW